MLTTLTVALAKAPPVLSVTVPTTLPLLDCAKALPAQTSRTANSDTNRRIDALRSFMKFPPSDFGGCNTFPAAKSGLGRRHGVPRPSKQNRTQHRCRVHEIFQLANGKGESVPEARKPLFMRYLWKNVEGGAAITQTKFRKDMESLCFQSTETRIERLWQSLREKFAVQLREDSPKLALSRLDVQELN